jgi:hypothetical protein
MKLSDFKLLTFDTYGTLIDWESGIYNALEPLLDKVPIKLAGTVCRVRNAAAGGDAVAGLQLTAGRGGALDRA